MKLAEFDNSGFDRGAGRGKEFFWLMLRSCFFDNSVMPWYGLRRFILKRLGASLGTGVVVKPGVKITFPWKLTVGNNCWLGEESWIMNLAPVTLGNDICVSQRVLLCTGSHDWSDPRFALVAKPIVLGNRVWICADVFVGPGVTIGEDTVVKPGSVVTGDLPAGMVCAGNPCEPVKPRNR